MTDLWPDHREDWEIPEDKRTEINDMTNPALNGWRVTLEHGPDATLYRAWIGGNPGPLFPTYTEAALHCLSVLRLAQEVA